MPTLYNDSNESAPDGRGGPRQPRMGTIEVLLYNMASMLAGVAVGYDVRLSNVSPIHPKLYPKRYVKLNKTKVFNLVDFQRRHLKGTLNGTLNPLKFHRDKAL